MKIGDRIKSRRKQLKLSVDELAKKLGKNRATIYRYESSEIENMPIDIIKPLAAALRVTPAFLMGWEDNENEIIKEPAEPYNYYPTAISAGLPLHVDGITENTVEEISLPDSALGKWAGCDDLFITKVNGDSMNKIIPDKSLIAVKPVELHQLKDGDIVVYSDGGDYSVKRFYQDEDNIIFRPDSHDVSYYDYVTSINNDDLVIHGKVVVYIVELD